MSDPTDDQKQAAAAARSAVPYWEDPVYSYLSRQHRASIDANDHVATAHFDGLIQELCNQTLSDELYEQLDADARADKKKRKLEGKKRRSPPSAMDPSPSVNVADLKKRIFNPQVSRENVIKALEALPPSERKATIAGLPPGLRRKLGSYLKS